MLVVEQDLGVAEAVLNQKRSGRSKRRVGYTELVRHAYDDGSAAVSIPSFVNGLAQLADGVEGAAIFESLFLRSACGAPIIKDDAGAVFYRVQLYTRVASGSNDGTTQRGCFAIVSAGWRQRRRRRR